MTESFESDTLGMISLSTSQIQYIPRYPWQILEQSSRWFPKNYIVYSERGSFTYEMFYPGVKKCARFISTLESDNFGVYLPNSPEFLLALFAVNLAKKILIPLAYGIKPGALKSKIEYADIDIIITHKEGYKKIRTEGEHCSCLKGIVLVDISGACTWVKIHPNMTGLAQEIPDDLFSICFTSGTTARPKGVMLTNQGIVGNALQVRNIMGLTRNDRFLVSRSCAQAGPIVGDILSTVSAGGAIIFMGDFFLPGVFFHIARLFQATVTLLVGTTLSMILDYPNSGKYNISSLRKVIFGGMKISEIIVSRALSKFPNIGFYCTYGLTEAGTRVCFCSPADLVRKPGSVGRPIHGCEVIIRTPEGGICETGKTGTVYIMSSYVMAGYYKLPVLSQAHLTPRGLLTNDLGLLDSEGFLYIHGRSDDVIIQGGYNVLPAEIEDVLITHPSVMEAVVFGTEDKDLGQGIVAFVKLLPNTNMDVPGLMKWSRGHLEEYRMPRELYILKEIPKDRYHSVSRNLAKRYYDHRIKETE